MKTLKLTIATVAAALALAASAIAQTVTPGQTTLTNPPSSFSHGIKEMAQAVAGATNWTVLGGYGRSSKNMLTGKGKSIAFVDVAYNFTENVGVVVGYDYLWGGNNPGQANAVRGGVTLQAPIHPLAFTGVSWLEGINGTPYVADLLATPKGQNAIGNIVATGINFNVLSIKNFELSLGAAFENRSGQSQWDGNYFLGHIGLTRTF